MAVPNIPRRREFDSAEMGLRGRIGAYRLHATHDSRETTSRARAVFLSRFEREVDPDGALPEAERLRRAEMARKAHFARMALKSAKKRSRRAEYKKAAGDQPAAGEEVRDAGAPSSL
jgi:hypothetical protein